MRILPSPVPVLITKALDPSGRCMQEGKLFIDEAASVGKEPRGAGNEDGAKSRALGLWPRCSKSLPAWSVPSIGASEGIMAGVYTKQISDPARTR